MLNVYMFMFPHFYQSYKAKAKANGFMQTLKGARQCSCARAVN